MIRNRTANMNIFDEHFKKVDESIQSARLGNYKVIESVVEISNAQKIQITRQRALADKEMEIAQLKASNKNTKTILMNALIERDELMTKKANLNATNERLCNSNESLHGEIGDLLRGDEVDSIREKFSFADQKKILKDIQDMRCKMIKNGFPLHLFA